MKTFPREITKAFFSLHSKCADAFVLELDDLVRQCGVVQAPQLDALLVDRATVAEGGMYDLDNK